MTAPVTVFDAASAARLAHNLKLLPRRVVNKHVRIGLNAAGGEGKRAAVLTARRESGTLAKSIRVKVVVPDASHNSAHHGKPSRLYVGPGRGIKAIVQMRKGKLRITTKKRLEKTGYRGNLIQVRRPTRYAHFAEKKAPAIGIAEDTIATTGMEKLRQKIDQGITKEVAALATK